MGKHRHGNRYNSEINDIVLGSIIKRQEDLKKSAQKRKDIAKNMVRSLSNRPVKLLTPINPNFGYCLADISRIIQKNLHRVHRKTVKRHVDEMVKNGDLREYGRLRIGKSFKRCYTLNEKRYPLFVSLSIHS